MFYTARAEKSKLFGISMPLLVRPITWLFTGRFDRFFYYPFRSANLENSAHLRSKYASEVERFHRLTPERRSTSAICGAFTTRESARRLTHVYMVQAQSLHILGRTSGERESTLAARACRWHLRGHTAALVQRKTFPKNHSRNRTVPSTLLQGLFPPRNAGRFLPRRSLPLG